MTELGARLKEARTARGYSLDDLQEMTKIQKRYLAGIEEGNYSMMPGPFYVRAFIKQYADAVGLSSDELLESYKQELPSSSNEEIQQTITTSPTRRRPITKSSNRLNDVFPMILVALFIVIAIVIFWYFYQNIAKNNHSAETDVRDEASLEQSEVIDDTPSEEDGTQKEPIEDPEVIDEPTPVQTLEVGEVEGDGETTNYTLSGTDTFSLKLVSRGRAWVSVRNQAGEEPLARELAEGETVTLDLSDVETARIRVGASSQIDVFVNDEKVEYGIPTSEQVTQNMLIQFTKQQ